MMDYAPGVGRCLISFALAIIFSATGIVLFLIGIFAPFSFWDIFIFSGPLLVFLSLVFWILWYLGNIEVSVDELLPKGGPNGIEM